MVRTRYQAAGRAAGGNRRTPGEELQLAILTVVNVTHSPPTGTGARV